MLQALPAIYLHIGQPIKYEDIRPGDAFLFKGEMCIKTQWTRYNVIRSPESVSIPTYGKNPVPVPCMELKLVPGDVNDGASAVNYEHLLHNVRMVQQVD